MKAFKHCLSSTTALALLFAATSGVAVPGQALAACTDAGAVTTCDAAPPNPHTATIGTGRAPENDGRTVIVEGGATINVDNANAISLHDNAVITVRSGATVTNLAPVGGSEGLYGTGANTIEVNSGATILIEAGAVVAKTGDMLNAEAINFHGSGNVLNNYGTVSAIWSGAFWFQDEETGVRNEINNYGLITRLDGTSLFGHTYDGPNSGIVMRNFTGGVLHGDLYFSSGDDDLHLYAGSLVEGIMNGGAGLNRLFLNGAAGTSDTLAGDISNFQQLIKEGQGQWTVPSPLAGFESTTVREGVLTLTGDNTNYPGATIVESAGVLEARAQSMPTRADPAANVANIQNDGVVRFTQPGGDDAVYAGQITGAGALEKTGDGVVTLAPDAGANLYAGGTFIRQGMIAAGADAAIGAPTGGVTLDGGSLRFTQSFALSPSRAVEITANNGGLDALAGVTGVIAQGITGPGGLSKTGAGSVVLNGVNTYAGPTDVRAGELIVGDSASAGASIGPGLTTVASGATLGGYGTVTGDVLNSGVIAVANAVAALSGGPNGNFTINGQLTNAGLLQIGGGGVGNTLTVTSYHGAGGAMAINTFLGGDGSPSDQLIINGGAATGSTAVIVTNVGGPGAPTPGNGILVVNAINGGATAPGAFYTARPVLAGPYAYTLQRGSRDGSDPDSWFLRTDDSASGGSGGGPGAPAFRRETALYPALPSMALLYGHAMLGTLHERVGEQELQRGLAGASGAPIDKAVWGRVIGSHGRFRDHGGYASGPSFSWDFFAFQVGMDLYRKEHADGSRDHLGVYVGVGRADGDVKHYAGGRAGDMRFDAYSIGAYWTHYGATGWYLDAVAQGTWYNARANSARVTPLSTDGFGVAFSLEAGYPFQLGDGWVLEPQAQIVLQKINLDSGRDGAAFIRFEKVESVAARVGARLSRSWILETANGPVRMNAWARANVWNEFVASPRASFSSDLGYLPFRSDMKGAWADLSAGVTAQINANTALYASASYQTSFDGRRSALSGKAGLRITW